MQISGVHEHRKALAATTNFAATSAEDPGE